MPGFNRRGPAGLGPLTGWGRGRCAPYGRRASRQSFGQQPGWGGRGRFPSRQRPYYETFNTRDEEMAQLKEEAAMLKGDLEAIEQRLSELEMQQER